MNFSKTVITILGLIAASLSSTSFSSTWKLMDKYYEDRSLYHKVGVHDDVIMRLESEIALNSYMGFNSNSLSYNSASSDHLSNYVTAIPLASEPSISGFERLILTAYLNNPNNKALSDYLALFNLAGSLVDQGNEGGQALKRTILANYFLNRSITLGNDSRWAQRALHRTDKQLGKVFGKVRRIDASEDHSAHGMFYDAFNYHEYNRHIAASSLLDDFAQDPNNVFTSFLTMAIHVWIGGESRADDPTVLYDFLVAGYFSKNTIDLAKRMEEAWENDPENNPRFRLAPILGGLSILERRWLAQLHGDDQAVEVIDEEHRQWYALHPKFHGFTVGALFFPEEENFLEGFVAWDEMMDPTTCEGARTCIDRPRFSFNMLGVSLGYVDFLLKMGFTEPAQQILTYRYAPVVQFDKWELGKDAWMHRENNLHEIADLYGNDNPDDDPMFVFFNPKNWSSPTSTCQVCHQAQGRFWSEEEKSEVLPLPDHILTVGEWPVFSTTWYGSSN